MGDNPGGGGSGEVTWTLARVLKRPELQSPNGKSLLYCSIPGSEMVEAARKAGVGGHAEGYVGAMTDNSYELPLLGLISMWLFIFRTNVLPREQI